MKGSIKMKLKNIIKIKNGYRVGFDITEDDYVVRKNMFGETTRLEISNIKLETKIIKLLSNKIDMSNKEVRIKDIKNDIYRGYAYFDIDEEGTYIRGIIDKYGIDY